MTTPHPHAEFLRALANGEPLKNFECKFMYWDSWDSAEVCAADSLLSNPEKWQVRRKLRTIRIGELDVPEPLRVAPKEGTKYWIASLNTSPWTSIWVNDVYDQRWLAHGICHLTLEAAEMHNNALILVSGGTP